MHFLRHSWGVSLRVRIVLALFIGLMVWGRGAIWAQSYFSQETKYGRVEVLASDNPQADARTLQDLENGRATKIIWGSMPALKYGKINEFTSGETAILSIFSGELSGHKLIEARWYDPANQLYRTTIFPLTIDSSPGPKIASVSLRFPSPNDDSWSEEEAPREGIWHVQLYLDGRNIAVQKFRFHD